MPSVCSGTDVSPSVGRALSPFFFLKLLFRRIRLRECFQQLYSAKCQAVVFYFKIIHICIYMCVCALFYRYVYEII